MNKFNLSLDDMSPHPKAGLNFESVKWCDKIIEKYPDFKVNLFVPAAYGRLGEPHYNVSSDNHHEWVEKLNALSANYRINPHGYKHRRSRKDWDFHKGIESNNNEWENLTYAQAGMLLDNIEEDFEWVKIKYTKTFRPPGWHIGREAAKLLVDRGYKIAGNNVYYEKLKDIPNIKWVSYNWDLLTAPPNENVIAYGHTSNWTTNYLNEERYNTIINFLNNKEFEFCFIEDM